MTPRRTLPLSAYLLTILAGPYWSFGWIFGGFTSFFLYVVIPRGWPPSIHIESLFALPFLLIPLLFVCIGLAFIGLSVREGLRAVALMQKGTVTDGVLVKLIDKGERINNEAIWWGEYYFTANNGLRYVCLGKVGKLTPELLVNAEHLLPTQQEAITGVDDDAPAGQPTSFDWQKVKQAMVPGPGRELLPNEPLPACPEGKAPVTGTLLYDPENPANAMPLSGVPGKFTLTPDGTLRPGATFLGGLIAPVLVIGIHYLVQHPEVIGRLLHQQ